MACFRVDFSDVPNVVQNKERREFLMALHGEYSTAQTDVNFLSMKFQIWPRA